MDPFPLCAVGCPGLEQHLDRAVQLLIEDPVALGRVGERQASGPRPSVSSRRWLTTSGTLLKSTVSAPQRSAAKRSRYGTWSTAMTRPARKKSFAAFWAINPTGPQPKTTTVSPGWIPAISAPK